MAHREPSILTGDKVVMIAGAHDGSHCSGVEQPVLDETLIDVNANHLAEGDEARGWVAVNIIEPDGPQPLAFQGTWSGLDARRLDQQRGGGLETCRCHFVHAARKSPRGLFYRVAQVPDRKV